MSDLSYVKRSTGLMNRGNEESMEKHLFVKFIKSKDRKINLKWYKQNEQIAHKAKIIRLNREIAGYEQEWRKGQGGQGWHCLKNWVM